MKSRTSPYGFKSKSVLLGRDMWKKDHSYIDGWWGFENGGYFTSWKKIFVDES